MAQTDSNHDKQPAATARRGGAAVPAGDIPPGIGFNELRQACEISALREDVARLGDAAETLRAHIESRVDEVRSRVAGLCAEELADPDVMAPLLQFAVSALISIRDHARDLHAGAGALDDDARPGWSAAVPPAPFPEPPPQAAPRVPPPPPSPPAPPPPPPPVAPPPPMPPRAPAPAHAPPPPPSRPIPIVAPSSAPPRRERPSSAGAIDWLSPVRR